MTDNATTDRAAFDVKPLPVYCTICGNQIGRRWSTCAAGYSDHKIGDPTQGQLLYRRSSSGGSLIGGVRIQP